MIKKRLLITILAAFSVSHSAFGADNTLSLQCSTGGNNAYAMVLDLEDRTLHLPMFDQIDFGTYPQMESSDQNTLVFFKSPTNKNNGIPMQIEVPVQALHAAPYSIHTVDVRVSQNWPGPIDENVYYTYHLRCTKVKEFAF